MWRRREWGAMAAVGWRRPPGLVGAWFICFYLHTLCVENPQLLSGNTGRLKEDAGWEDYDLRFTATLTRWNSPDGSSNARRGNWES
jgi:hypothetical protein